MNRKIERASEVDATAVHMLLTECGQAMASAGFDNWNPPASQERVRSDIRDREVYLVRQDGQLIATVTASLDPTVAYAPDAAWVRADAKALYVNRLAVRPDLQNSGIGGWLTEAMEERARELGCDAVRLDALAANGKLLAFYTRSGYEKRFEREHSGWRFVCMEKLLG